MRDLGVVICNFNKGTYLRSCLESLLASDFQNMTYEVIVVDNASDDGSPEMVREHYPQVTLLENETNLGGAGGFDRGIRYCIEKRYSYVTLLDNDVILEENTIITLVEHIRSNPEAGVAGSKICTMDDPSVLQELGSFIDWEKEFNFFTPLKGYRDSSNLPDVVSCDYVPACCFVTTAEVLARVGSFNTDYFIYWDDMDWCTRVKCAGYEIHAINASRVYHKMGASTHPTTFGSYYFERNRVAFFLTYLPDNQLDNFLDSVSRWLLSSTFFLNQKKSYETAISFMMGLDDLLMSNLGARPESVLVRTPACPFHITYDMKKNDRVALRLNADVAVTRRIYQELSRYFETPLVLVTNENDVGMMRGNFPGHSIIPEEAFDAGAYDHVFHALGHLLEYTSGMPKLENGFFVDGYINISRADAIETLLVSYQIHTDIYMNIYKPLLARRFMQIRARLT